MFGKHARNLYELGWNIIPVHGKRPVIPYWSQYSDIPPSKYEVKKWSEKYRDENIGLVLGGSSGIIAIDIDLDDEDLSTAIQNAIHETVGTTPIIRFGRYPRAVMLFKGLDIKTSVGPVEFLSTGRQVVIFGKHPLTKKDYWYSDFSPLEIEPESLPSLSLCCIDKVKKIIQPLLPKKEWNGHTNVGDTDYFEALKDQRKALTAYKRRAKICEQLQGAEPGNLHNTLVSCVAALASDGCSPQRIKQIVEHNYNAPKDGMYSDVWKRLDRLIASTVKKFGKKNDIQRTQ